MKILVFSDSHRSQSGMVQAIDEQQPDQVIHLGDLISDAEELSYFYPKLPICMVPGNCDGWTTVPSVKQITLQGRSILLSHGHLWGVKSGYEAAIAQARSAGADILLFGHTHQPVSYTHLDVYKRQVRRGEGVLYRRQDPAEGL